MSIIAHSIQGRDGYVSGALGHVGADGGDDFDNAWRSPYVFAPQQVVPLDAAGVLGVGAAGGGRQPGRGGAERGKPLRCFAAGAAGLWRAFSHQRAVGRITFPGSARPPPPEPKPRNKPFSIAGVPNPARSKTDAPPRPQIQSHRSAGPASGAGGRSGPP